MSNEPNELALAHARIVDLETQVERQQQCIAEALSIIEYCLPYLPAASGIERDARKALNPQQEATGDESAPAMLT